MSVPEQDQPRRRRRPPVQSVPEQEPPRKIVIAGDEEPDWLVSASNISGAASRRSRQAAQDRHA